VNPAVPIAYSLLALAAFAWIVVAYRHAPALSLWHAPRLLQLCLLPVMLLSSILSAGGLTTPNPVIVRSDRLFDNPEIVRGILRISRNSFFWGIALIAAAHVAIAGSVPATLAFGSVALLGFAGGPILDAKKARRHGATWRSFTATTSEVPFLAIAQGRQHLALGEIGWWRIALGVGVFLVILLFHQAFFGGDVVSIVLG
jgi:uncharacterized membrane protein